MKRLVVIFLLIAIMGFLRYGMAGYPHINTEANSTLVFGFLLLISYLLSDVTCFLKIPRITAYLFAGMLFGPYMLGFVDQVTLDQLDFIEKLALSFIALVAGGELHLRLLRKRRKILLNLLTISSIILFLGVAFTLYGMHQFFKFQMFSGLSNSVVLFMCVICGLLAIARSPSSAIAIISETHASGVFTETVLAITVVADALALPLFTVVVSLGRMTLFSGNFEAGVLMGLGIEIIVSVSVGILTGYIIAAYFKYIRVEKIFFLLAVTFLIEKFSIGFSHWLNYHFSLTLHLEPMLICMTAGFVIQNFTTGGDALIHAVERSSLPIYVLFFTQTGASLNIGILSQTWTVALLIVALRAFYMITGSYFSSRMSGESVAVSGLYGWSFLTQAGVSLGLISILVSQFPEWGELLGTVLIAAIILNQMIGPIAMKTALELSGETPPPGILCDP